MLQLMNHWKLHLKLETTFEAYRSREQGLDHECRQALPRKMELKLKANESTQIKDLPKKLEGKTHDQQE